MVHTVHDLPQLYQKPTPDVLLNALNLLSAEPSNFQGSISSPLMKQQRVAEAGVPRYLTSVIASSLAWIDDDQVKEAIWSAASSRLSERSGRNAMPSMTRTFAVDKGLNFTIHEPSLTEDNLGLKTWTSSLLLARRLAELARYLPEPCPPVLELGAGTGLVGMAAAAVWSARVMLTDLPEILPNLRKNLELNADLIQLNKGAVDARVLDWNDETDVPRQREEGFKVVVAADPIYSPDHPRLLVSTLSRWMSPSPEARFIVELPLRDRYDQERQSLRDHLHQRNFELLAEGVDQGFDDWQDRDGEPIEVHCWWSVWSPG